VLKWLIKSLEQQEKGTYFKNQFASVCTFNINILLFQSRSAPPDVDLALQNSSKTVRKPRQEKFTQKEILKGLHLFAKNRELLLNQKGGAEFGKKKVLIWSEIADVMSKESGIKRTWKQVKAKINQVRSREKGPGMKMK